MRRVLKNRRALDSAVRPIIERLEDRRLLYTITSTEANPQTFFIADPEVDIEADATEIQSRYIQIDLRGNTQIELVGYSVLNPGVATNFVLGQTIGNNSFPIFGNIDIHHIYIAQADINSSIALQAIEIDTEGADPPTYNPYTESPTAFAGYNITAGEFQAIGTPGDVGVVWIGGRDGSDEPARFQIPSIAAGQIGVMPPPVGGRLAAGITTAPGVSVGRIMIGGVVTGEVNLQGSIDTFYAGWIITGVPTGQNSAATISNPENFVVEGDLRNLITLADLGSSSPTVDSTVTANYFSGFDMRVDGEIGQIVTQGSVLGRVAALNDPLADSFNDDEIAFREVEYRVGEVVGTESGINFANGLLGSNLEDSAFLWNDNLSAPQYLGTIGPDNGSGYVQVEGELNVLSPSPLFEPADTYALALLAGKDYQIRFEDPTAQLVMTVWDPQNRAVAASVSRFNGNANRVFSFTPSMPGIYRFQITPPQPDVPAIAPGAYTLTVGRAGNVSLGAIAAVESIYGADYTSVTVENGDLGAMYAGEQIAYEGAYTFSAGTLSFVGREDILVTDGDFRAMDAAQIGISSALSGFGANIDVLTGNVGLLRAREDVFNIETAKIKGNLQLGEALDAAFIQLSAGGALGAFRAGNMSTLNPSVFRVNADNTGNDGVIGLIDVKGDFGSIGGQQPSGNSIEDFGTIGADPSIPTTGGPVINAGAGGNVRYINIGGQVFQDALFGFGGNGPRGAQRFGVNETATFRDDGGGTIEITPQGFNVPNPDFISLIQTPDVPPFLGPSINVITYAARHGGVVVVDVSASGQLVGEAEVPTLYGIAVRGGAGGAEISNISMMGLTTEGGGLVIGPEGRPVFSADGTFRPLNVVITGNDPVDVFNIEGTEAAIGSLDSVTTNSAAAAGSPEFLEELDPAEIFGAFTNITNETRGEIVGVRVGSVARLRANGNIGIGKATAGIRPGSTDVLSTEFPFGIQQGGVLITGNVGELQAGGAIGNINIGGTIGRLQAGSRGDDASEFQGIAAPVLIGGQVFDVSIGEGIAHSGTGTNGTEAPIDEDVWGSASAASGLFATGAIRNVTNDGRGDIRGDIVSTERISSVQLRNGSIINADIEVNASLADGSRDDVSGEVEAGDDTQNRPRYEIDEIVVSGDGGIIGSNISAPDIGRVDVSGGFGIFTSFINGVGSQGSIDFIGADNYGLRYLLVSGVSNLNRIVARGDGSQVPTSRFSDSVRTSEQVPVDPFWGERIDPESGLSVGLLNDIHAVLGTSAAVPQIANVTITGVMENVDVRSASTIGSASAFTMRTRNINILPETAAAFPMQFVAGSRIGSINTRDIIDGLAITTGRLGEFTPGSDVSRLRATISGQLKSMNIRGSLLGDSEINAIGRNGKIGSITIAGDLDGTIRAQKQIKSIRVGGDVNGVIEVTSGNGGKQIGTLNIDGALSESSLNVNGNVGTIILAQGAGSSGQSMTINGNLGLLRVDSGNFGFDLSVLGNLNRADIRGTVTGNIDVAGSMGKFVVTGPGSAADVAVAGNVSVGRTVNSFNVANGSMTGSLSAAGDISQFLMSNGNFGPNAILESSLGRINNVNIGGSVWGSIEAVSGSFSNVQIGGDLGNGVDPLSIDTGNVKTFRVGGSVRSGVNAMFAQVGTLQIGGDVDAGASIIAESYRRKEIGGAVNGTVIP